MFSTQPHEPYSSAPPPPGGDGEDQAALTLARLAELDRLRNFSFAQAEPLKDLAKVVPGDEAPRMFGKKGTIQRFDRIPRAFPQNFGLEFGLRGPFNAPDRDATPP